MYFGREIRIYSRFIRIGWDFVQTAAHPNERNGPARLFRLVFLGAEPERAARNHAGGVGCRQVARQLALAAHSGELVGPEAQNAEQPNLPGRPNPDDRSTVLRGFPTSMFICIHSMSFLAFKIWPFTPILFFINVFSILEKLNVRGKQSRCSSTTCQMLHFGPKC